MFSSRVWTRLCAPAAVAACTTLLAGCGNIVDTEVAGQIGLSVNEDGDLIAHVQSCDLPVNKILVVAEDDGSGEGDAPPTNADGSQGYFLVSEEKHTGYFTINLTHPGPEWVPDDGRSTPLKRDLRYSVLAPIEGMDAEVKSVSVLSPTVRLAGPDKVAVSLYADQPAEVSYKETDGDYGFAGVITVDQLREVCS